MDQDKADSEQLARLGKLRNVENWRGAIALVGKMLQRHPNDHWLLATQSSNYYVMGDYEASLAHARKAQQYAPECPMVLWELAVALDATGREGQARRVMLRLLSQGHNGLRDNPCDHGGPSGESLLNDRRFWLGRSYFWSGDRQRAREYLRAHLQHRRPGLPSCRSRREAEKLLRRIERYNVMKKQTARLNQLMVAEDWPGAIALGKKMLREDPEDHWVLSRLSSSYHEVRDYDTALVYARRAQEIMPECPMVLWDLAGALHSTGQRAQARRIWKGLLDQGLEGLLQNPCNEGKRWNESLLNDCRFRLGDSYFRSGKRPFARQYLRGHLDHRRPGLRSMYALREVEGLLREVGE